MSDIKMAVFNLVLALTLLAISKIMIAMGRKKEANLSLLLTVVFTILGGIFFK